MSSINEALPPQFHEWHGRLGWQLEDTRRKLLDNLKQKQFEYIHTPYIDHFDTLSIGAGSLNPNNAFRFTDPLTGKLLASRTDISPQIARLDNKRNSTNIEKYCYAGESCIAQAQSLSVRNPYQVGAEIFGDDSIEADMSMVKLALELCRLIEPNHHQYQHQHGYLVDLGHSGMIKRIINMFQFNSEHHAKLLRIVQLKSKSDLTAFCKEQGLNDDQQDLLLLLINEQISNLEQLNALEQKLLGMLQTSQAQFQVINKIGNYFGKLKKLTRGLEAIKDIHWHVDLSNLTGISYHSGFIFNLYRGHHLLCRGGRYDNLVKHHRPATGFTMDLNQILLNK